MHQITNVVPVDDAIRGGLSSRKFRKGRQQIHRGGHFVVFNVSRNVSGGSHDARNAQAAVPRCGFCSAKRVRCAAAIRPIILHPLFMIRAAPKIPRSVVAGKNDVCIFVESLGFQGLKNAADMPVDFLDDISV